jgi:glutamate---cysteine ligase / carboxylate-amine ligase
VPVARTLGVEEEFLLVDERSGRPAPAADAIVAPARAAGPGAHPENPAAGTVEREFTLQQVETATPVVSDLTALRRSLVALRAEVGGAAGAAGTLLLATGTSPLPVTAQTTPNPRYRRMTELYGLTAREQLTCGCHVHVGVASDDEAVGALDRIRPWLSPLVALAANSPFWQGQDTAYASYRSQVWGRWPTAGATAPFGSAAAYRQCVADLLDSGAILDEGMVYFDVRLSRAYPTLEIRVADVALEVDDAVLVAALAGALVETGARLWRDGRPPLPVRTELIRLATWRASRSGLEGDLVDVVERRPVPAPVLLDRLVEHVRPALEDAGHLADVSALVQQVLGRGTGAARQRVAFRRNGRLRDVLALLAARTLAG